MDVMKKFKKWLIMFGFLVIIINILTHLVMLRPVNAVPYRVDFTSPNLRITTAESSDIRVYVRGEITNNTGRLIRLAQLRFEFYNERGGYLGSEYKEIRLFNARQTINIDVSRNVRNVDNVVIRWIDEVDGEYTMEYDYEILEENEEDEEEEHDIVIL